MKIVNDKIFYYPKLKNNYNFIILYNMYRHQIIFKIKI